jgi:hypothetical protein
MESYFWIGLRANTGQNQINQLPTTSHSNTGNHEWNVLASVVRGVHFGPRDSEAQKTCAYLWDT